MTDKQRQQIEDEKLQAWKKDHDEAVKQNTLIEKGIEESERKREQQDRENNQNINTTHGAGIPV